MSTVIWIQNRSTFVICEGNSSIECITIKFVENPIQITQIHVQVTPNF